MLETYNRRSISRLLDWKFQVLTISNQQKELLIRSYLSLIKLVNIMTSEIFPSHIASHPNDKSIIERFSRRFAEIKLERKEDSVSRTRHIEARHKF